MSSAIGRPLKSDEYETEIKPAKKFTRLGVGPNVQPCVKRFLLSTMPSKLWYENFESIRERYMMIHYLRKYDGWFVCLFVNTKGEVEWQTMGGYIFKFMEGLMQEFIAYVQGLVTDGRIETNHAFKLEFTARDATGREVLHDIGIKQADELEYFLVVTDYFQGYSDEMDDELKGKLMATYSASSAKGQAARTSARNNMSAEVDAAQWRALWATHFHDIGERLRAAKALLLGENDRMQFGKIFVEVAEVRETPIVPNPIFRLARELKESEWEGYVLHCVTEDFKYDIYKFKLEYLGGLGHYYTWPNQIDEPDAGITSKYAGRQFVVKILTAECLPNSNIPYQVGVGYWDPDEKKYIVTNCIKLTGVFKNKWTCGASRLVSEQYPVHSNKYLDLKTAAQTVTKHSELTALNRSMANMIAFVAEHTLPPEGLYDLTNLKFSDTYQKESSRSLINLSTSGILLGGSANMVYQLTFYHLQAPVAKCVGIDAMGTSIWSEALGKRWREVKEATGTRDVCLRTGVKSWDINDWNKMQSLMEFNASDVLSSAEETASWDVLMQSLSGYVVPTGIRVESRPYNYDRLSVWYYRHDIWSTSTVMTSRTIHSMAVKGVGFRNVTFGKFSPGQPNERLGSIDIILVNRKQWDASASTMYPGTPNAGMQLFEHVIQHLKHRCLFVADSYASEIVKDGYHDPYSRRMIFKTNKRDSEGKPWTFSSKTEILRFLKERQDARLMECGTAVIETSGAKRPKADGQ